MAVEVKFEINAGIMIKRSLGVGLASPEVGMYQKLSGRFYGGELTDGVRRGTHGVVNHGELYLGRLYISHCQRQGIKVSHTVLYGLKKSDHCPVRWLSVGRWSGSRFRASSRKGSIDSSA